MVNQILAQAGWRVVKATGEEISLAPTGIPLKHGVQQLTLSDTGMAVTFAGVTETVSMPGNLRQNFTKFITELATEARNRNMALAA